jgi:5-methylcytosine-specific restriction endonuclease McrA
MIEPLCRLCLEAGRVTPATAADHVVPHRGDYTAFRLGQLRSLCADCHNTLDRTNRPRAPVRENGTPSDPNHPWNRPS